MKQHFKLFSWAIVVCSAWGLGSLFNLNLDEEVVWIDSIYKQKIALAAQVEAPKRLLLVGGSATHFGLDALQLEQKLNIPVLNLGLHAGLGLDGVLGSVVDEIQTGDAVILFPEYTLLLRDDGNSRNTLTGSFGFRIGQPGLGESEPNQVLTKIMSVGTPSLSAIVHELQANILQKNQQAYSDQLSARGDAVTLKDTEQEPYLVRGEVSSYALQRIERFKEEVERQGGNLIIGLPWVLIPEDDEESIQYASSIINSLSQIAPVVYDKDSLGLKTDSALFGDTYYHLTYQGRELRTQELGQQLQRLIHNSPQ